jgi:hypothetical protein
MFNLNARYKVKKIAFTHSFCLLMIAFYCLEKNSRTKTRDGVSA